MTYREALITAIDALRTRDDREHLQAAKELERKLSRLRVRTLLGVTDRDWCDCGERKRPELNFCHECNRAFPLKLTIAFLGGRGKESARAFREMTLISKTRLQVETMRKAA